MPTCTMSAIIATMINTTIVLSMHAPAAPKKGRSHRAVNAGEKLRLRFAQIRFAAGFHRRGNGILFARGNIFAALDQFVGAFTKLARFALRKILAFIRLLGQKITRVFAGLGREQNSHQRAYAETYKKISDLGTHIVSHSNLPRNRSIALLR